MKESNINMHQYYLPTYDECRQICDANDNFIFYESKHDIDGYNVSIFSYRLAHNALFTNPIPGNDTIRAFESRGITFVFNEDGSLYKRFLLLEKFWNINQTESVLYDNIKNLKVKSVHDKLDGSVISFIKLPNDKIYAKSMASFISDQAVAAQSIYDTNSKIRNFVTYMLSNDIIPIFEYVSPNNRIVLKYDDDKLVLLKLRNNKTGRYIDFSLYQNKIDEFDIETAKSIDLSLDEIMQLATTKTGIEGWVIQFENDLIVKQKTAEYFSLHELFTEDLNRENRLIKLIVNEEIDDVMSQVPTTTERMEEIERIIEVVNNYIKRVYNESLELSNEFIGSYGNPKDRADYYFKYGKHDLYYFALSKLKGHDLLSTIKEYILKKTYFLNNARNWIEENS